MRPLGIPTIKDRVAQTAAKLILEPIFEADLSDAAHGYRPGRGGSAFEKVLGPEHHHSVRPAMTVAARAIDPKTGEPVKIASGPTEAKYAPITRDQQLEIEAATDNLTKRGELIKMKEVEC